MDTTCWPQSGQISQPSAPYPTAPHRPVGGGGRGEKKTTGIDLCGLQV